MQAYIVCCKIINSILPLSPGFLSIVCEVLTFDEAGFTFPSWVYGVCVQGVNGPQREDVHAGFHCLLRNVNALLPRSAGFVSATGDVVTFDGASFTFSGVTGCTRYLRIPATGCTCRRTLSTASSARASTLWECGCPISRSPSTPLPGPTLCPK